MSKQREYESKVEGITATIQLFRSYVVDRSNSKEHHDKLFNRYHDQMNIPEMKEIFKRFYQEDEKLGLFGNRDKVVEKHLSALYQVNTELRTGDKQFAKMISADMKETISMEARQLNKGSRFFAVDLAVQEIDKLQTELKGVKALNAKLNTALTNFVNNVKERFGLKDQEVDQMMNTANDKKVEVINFNSVVKGGEKLNDQNLER